MRTLMLAFVTVMLAFGVSGCVGDQSAPPTSSAPAEAPSEVQQAANDIASIATMENADKRSLIASSFPVEVPVPAGEIVSAEAQGENAWDYEMIVSAEPEVLAEWYRVAYTARSWVVVGQRQTEDVAGVELDLQKGNAQSRVVVTEEAGGARVSVILGVGVPVLQTQ